MRKNRKQNEKVCIPLDLTVVQKKLSMPSELHWSVELPDHWPDSVPVLAQLFLASDQQSLSPCHKVPCVYH